MKKNILYILSFLLVSLCGASFCVSASVTIQNNVTRYIDTEGNVFSGIGTITITSGNQSIVMLDRNLGATARGIGCHDLYGSGLCTYEDPTYGYHFQRGNNYGFSNEVSYYPVHYMAYVDSDKPDASGYGWDNPYVSGTYIESYVDWSSVTNNTLWGGNLESNPDYMKQGPCPEGFHVPSMLEIQKLIGWTGPTGSIYYDNYLMPYAAERYNKVALRGPFGSRGFYWTATPASFFTIQHFVSDEIFYDYAETGTVDRSYAHSIRCFKDNYSSNQIQLVLSYDTVGGQPMQGQTVLLGNKAHVPGYDPKKEGYIFSGWYKDPQYTQEFLFLGEPSGLTQNTTIYAKRLDPNDIVDPQDTGNNNTGNNLTGNIEVGLTGLGLIIGTPKSFDLGTIRANTTNNFVLTQPFWIEDLRGATRGHYTTIQLNGLYQEGGDGVITGVRLIDLSGAVLSGGIANGTWMNPSIMNSRGVDITKPVLYFYRRNGDNNNGVVNRYISLPTLRIKVSRNTPTGTYRGNIVFTLYDIDYR